jgi:hypothetical protein
VSSARARERLLLALTVIGFVVPNVMLAIFIADHGLEVGTYFGDWFGTLPAAQISVDIGIAAVAFLAWTAWDGPRSGVERWWVVIPATFLVGLCFGLPLYLLLREKAVTPAIT